MSDIKKRLDKIIEVINRGKGTPTPLIFFNYEGDTTFILNEGGDDPIIFNTEQEVKEYANKQTELTGVKKKYVIIKILKDSPELERVMYEVD